MEIKTRWLLLPQRVASSYGVFKMGEVEVKLECSALAFQSMLSSLLVTSWWPRVIQGKWGCGMLSLSTGRLVLTKARYRNNSTSETHAVDASALFLGNSYFSYFGYTEH